MEKSNQRIEIALSKSKIFFMLIGALLFISGGFLFVSQGTTNSDSVWSILQKIPIAGYATILFFATCAVFLLFQLFVKKPGLIIDKSSLTDHSSGVSAGQIFWTDIEKISVLDIYLQRIIMLKVKNPQEYIDRQKNVFKRKLMQLNYKTFGTPLSITSNGLKISFNELLADLTCKFEESKKK